MENMETRNWEAANRQIWTLRVRWTERQINELWWLHDDDYDDDDDNNHGDGDYNYDDDEIDSSNMIEPSHFFIRTKQLNS
jgi:hypothetical protein